MAPHDHTSTLLSYGFFWMTSGATNPGVPDTAVRLVSESFTQFANPKSASIGQPASPCLPEKPPVSSTLSPLRSRYAKPRACRYLGRTQEGGRVVVATDMLQWGWGVRQWGWGVRRQAAGGQARALRPQE